MIRKSFSYCLLALLLLTFYAAQGQNRYTLDGYIKDSSSGESIIGATVSINKKTVVSNQYGFYSITLPEADYDVFYKSKEDYAIGFWIVADGCISRPTNMPPKGWKLSENE